MYTAICFCSLIFLFILMSIIPSIDDHTGDLKEDEAAGMFVVCLSPSLISWLVIFSGYVNGVYIAYLPHAGIIIYLYIKFITSILRTKQS